MNFIRLSILRLTLGGKKSGITDHLEACDTSSTFKLRDLAGSWSLRRPTHAAQLAHPRYISYVGYHTYRSAVISSHTG